MELWKTSFDYTMSQAESAMKNEGDELSKGYMCHHFLKKNLYCPIPPYDQTDIHSFRIKETAGLFLPAVGSFCTASVLPIYMYKIHGPRI